MCTKNPKNPPPLSTEDDPPCKYQMLFLSHSSHKKQVLGTAAPIDGVEQLVVAAIEHVRGNELLRLVRHLPVYLIHHHAALVVEEVHPHQVHPQQGSDALEECLKR